MKKIIIRDSIGFILGLGVYLIICLLSDSKIDIAVLASILIVVLLFCYNDYQQFKKIRKDIDERFDTFLTGQDFVHDNLYLSKQNKNITVRNLLQWNESVATNETIKNESLQTIIDDFDQLMANNDKINTYFKGKQVLFKYVEKSGLDDEESQLSKTVNY
jgi:hypothetical protein